MARSLEIPAVVGTGDKYAEVKSGEDIIVDALEGTVILNPTEDEVKTYSAKRDEFLAEKELLKQLKDKDAVSRDGRKVGAWANIGSPKDIDGVLKNARSLEIPAVVGTGDKYAEVKSGENIIVDALEGTVILNPTEDEVKTYSAKRDEFLAEKELLKQLKDKDAVSRDGRKVGAWANIGSPKDIDGVLKNGAQGIGLYRTEFLFMNNDRFPSEDEQFEAYKAVVESLEGKPVTIRTMDIGGDKSLPYMELPKEENPFLGWRALRVCLDRPEILKTQFRALLRASAFGYVKIMLPMIISLTEVRKSRELLKECMEELRAEGIAFDENVQLGIMVETPAVAFRARSFAKECDFFSIGTNDLTQYTLAVDRGNEKISKLYNSVETPAVAFRARSFAKECDFFSIGTNDLTQYTLAVDRGNEKISKLYNSYNPAVLQAIKCAIDGAHAENITISMCGEFAGDENATAVLFGMGLDAFSMSAISVPRIKRNVLALDKAECEALVERVLDCATAEEVMEEITKFNKATYNR